MKIYLVGVYHNFQTQKHPDLVQFLRNVCAMHKINSIAEEMNLDALQLAKVDKTTVLELAQELALSLTHTVIPMKMNVSCTGYSDNKQSNFIYGFTICQKKKATASYPRMTANVKRFGLKNSERCTLSRCYSYVGYDT